MIVRRSLFWVALPIAGLMGCSQMNNIESERAASPAASPSAVVAESTVSPAAATTEASDSNFSQLFSKPWRVTEAASEPALGSLYVFLPNGTLLQTSCVETYRISGWTVDKDKPEVLQVSEDGERPAFTAEILELSDTTLRLQQNLSANNETQEITLTAVDEEFVCPDLPR